MVASISGLLALFATTLTALLQRDVRQIAALKADLQKCKESHLQVRQQNELFFGALLGLLPEQKRLELLRMAGEQVPESWD